MKRLTVPLVTVLLSVFVCFSQESRGTLTGTVTDPQGAVVPGAKVEVKDLGTNGVTTVTTSDRGVYSLPPMNPGAYTVTATAAGFKKAVQNNIEIRVAERRQLDIALEIGGANESVTITAEAPLLETASASGGTVINADLVATLPLLGANSYGLMQIASGTSHISAYPTQLSERPFDNGGMDGYAINGGPSGGNNNRYLIDGISNNVNEGMGFVPPQSAVSEFKMMTNIYDAEYGKTGGGVANVSLKSGTNTLHGSANFNFRNDHLNANLFQYNRQGIKKARYYWLNPTITVTGPVFLPKLYSGRDKTFFMFSWEQLRDGFPSPSSRTYPTALQKSGDFSQTIGANGKAIAIYDPLSTVCDSAGQNCTRTVFGGSKIPDSRQDPMIKALMKYYPNPQLTVARGVTNFTAAPNIRGDMYNSYMGRIDHNVGDRNKIFGNFQYGNRQEIITNDVGLSGDLKIPYPNSGTWRINSGVGVNWTSMINTSTVSNLKVNYLRHNGLGRWTTGDDFDATTLGYSKALQGLLNGAVGFPAFSASGFSGFGGTGSRTSTFDNNWSIGWTVSTVKGSHSIKGGMEATIDLRNSLGNNTFPTLASFGLTFTQANPLGGTDSNSGDGLATALLGYPNSSSFTPTVLYAWSNHYYAYFAQDDWRISRKLTFNLGLRYDYQTPFSERYDRQIIGFDTNVSYLVGTVTARGGPIYADRSNRYSTRIDRNNIGPRIGFALTVTPKIVMRGGWGVTYTPNAPQGGTTGFSATTSSNPTSVDGSSRYPVVLNATTGRGLFANGGTEIFPSALSVPPGRKLIAPTIGGSLSYNNQDARSATVQQFNLGLQFELPLRSVLNVEYNGSRTRNIGVSRSINTLTVDQYTTLGSKATTPVTNPYGVIAGTSCLNNTTFSTSQSLYMYPQFCSLSVSGVPVGKLWYNSLQARWDKRITRGLTSLATLTWGKNMQRSDYHNGSYDDINNLRTVLTGQDQKFRLNLTMAWVFPFAKDGLTSNAAAKAITKYALGGWTISGMAYFQSGTYISAPGAGSNPVQSTGVDPTKPTTAWPKRTLERYFNTCTINASGVRQWCASADEPAAWFLQPLYTLGGMSPRFANLKNERSPSADVSIYKSFPIYKERVRFDLTAQAFNLTNSPWFGAGDNSAGIGTTATSNAFGVVTQNQGNNPRIFQLAGKLSW
jgi:hypothetical protein